VSRGQLAKYLLPRRLLRTKYGSNNETHTLCLIHVPESLTAVKVKRDSMSEISNVPIQPERWSYEVHVSLSTLTIKRSLLPRGFTGLQVNKFQFK
jgi:hypothetical protein